MRTAEGNTPTQVQADLDAALWEQVNRFTARTGPFTTGLVLCALAVGALSSLVSDSPPVRILMPALLGPFLVLSWQLGRKRMLNRGWAWFIVLGMGAVPLIVAGMSLLVSAHGPASLWVSPVGWTLAVMVAGSIVFLERYLPLAMGCLAAVETVILYRLAEPELAEISAAPLVLEMLSSVPMVGVRCVLYVALGMMMSLCVHAFRNLVERVVEKDVHARAEHAARAKAETASDAKSAFLANMSHELRTPLNAILGYAQILGRRPDLDVAARSGLRTIEDSSRQLKGVIDDVLDMAKIEADRIDLDARPVHLGRLVDSVVELLVARARAKGIGLRVALDPTVPNWVLADELRLRQILTNLLGNAVKFTHTGRVYVDVTAVPAGIRFEVVDTGPGISAADQQKIFLPFEQVGAADRRAQGTGLGLPICRRLVGLMGGSIRVESEEGQGARFIVVLPLAPVEPPAVDFQSPFVSGYEGSRRRVLVADDVALNRSIVMDLLEPLGFEIALAEDGEQALRMAHETEPDLVLMDLVMPRIDGFEAARSLRADARLAGVPIIAVSASVLTLEAERDGQLFHSVVHKPVDHSELLSAIGDALQLTWIGASRSTLPPARARTGEHASAMLPPPPERVAQLRALVELGDLAQVETECEALATEARYLAFAEHARQLAVSFDDAALLKFLAQVEQPAGQAHA